MDRDTHHRHYDEFQAAVRLDEAMVPATFDVEGIRADGRLLCNLDAIAGGLFGGLELVGS